MESGMEDKGLELGGRMFVLWRVRGLGYVDLGKVYGEDMGMRGEGRK